MGLLDDMESEKDAKLFIVIFILMILCGLFDRAWAFFNWISK